MNQHINLLNLSLLPPRQWLTVNRLAIAALATYAICLVINEHKIQRTQLATQKLRAMTSENDLIEKDALGHQLTLIQHKPDPGLDQEIDALKLRITQFSRVEAALREGANLGNPKGYSRYLQALTEHTIPGIWLTAFSMEGQSMTLTGQSSNETLIPKYIQALSKAEALKGTTFSRLEAKPTNLSAGLLEFTLSNQDKIKDVPHDAQ